MSHRSRTLVIGGAGYIGAYLIPDLLATDRKVTVLGRKSIPLQELPEGAVYVSGDFSNLGLIGELLDRHDEVIHLAYATVPNTSFENPLVDMLQNLPPTVQLFTEAAIRDIKLVLVSSGGTIYGDAIKLPIQEDHPTKPISPYGVTKLTLESYAHLYRMTHGLKCICVRPSNAFGAGQRPFVGQGFISTAMASALSGQSIRIFGLRGTVRDYIYVSDIASAIVHALEHGHVSETYNIGSGIGLSNMDVLEAMTPLINAIGFDLHVDHLPERIFDVKANVLDSAKLRDHTGWQPRIGFHEGLLLTREWLRRYQHD